MWEVHRGPLAAMGRSWERSHKECPHGVRAVNAPKRNRYLRRDWPPWKGT
ncbi:hypothetical protein GCM10010149_48650 [Nonomuraea roseoviolacea subsp. roseoviolacea]